MAELLTKEEIDRLIISLAQAQETFTEEDAVTVVKWAEQVRIDMALLGNVLKRTADVSVKDGEVYFQINALGKKYLETLGADDDVLSSDTIM